MSQDSDTTSGAPKKRIGLTAATSISISLMIGSGIFSTPSSVIFLVGSPIMGLIMYIIGGFFSLGGSYSFVELGIMFPKNGGTLRYLGHAFPNPRALLSFLFSWCMIICIRPGGIAANSPVFGQYFIYGIFGSSNLEIDYPAIYKNREWIYRGIGLFGMSLITLVCMLSVKWSLRLLRFFTVLKLSVLIFISITGILVLTDRIKSEKNDNWSSGFKYTKKNLGGYASALSKVFYSYDGWSNIAYNVGEVIDPAKVLPLSATFAISSVTGLYTLAIVAFYSVVPLDVAVDSKEIIAAEFTNRIFGHIVGGKILPVLIGCTVLGSVLSQVFAIGRIVSSAAELGYIPKGKKLATYSKRFKTPHYALAFNWVLATLYIVAPPPGDVFNLLVDFIQYPTWFFYGLTSVGCLYLRFKYPSHPSRQFRSSNTLTVIFVLVCIYLTVFPFIPFTKQNGSYPYYLSPALGVCTLILGLIPYYLRMYWWADKTGNDYSGWITREEEEYKLANSPIQIE